MSRLLNKTQLKWLENNFNRIQESAYQLDRTCDKIQYQEYDEYTEVEHYENMKGMLWELYDFYDTLIFLGKEHE